MATGDADALFLDTNVLVYANVAHAPLHAEALEAIHARHDRVRRSGPADRCSANTWPRSADRSPSRGDGR